MRFVIYLLLTFSSVVLHALKKCEKVSVCKCATDEGVIDLSRLAGVGSNIPSLLLILNNIFFSLVVLKLALLYCKSFDSGPVLVLLLHAHRALHLQGYCILI